MSSFCAIKLDDGWFASPYAREDPFDGPCRFPRGAGRHSCAADRKECLRRDSEDARSPNVIAIGIQRFRGQLALYRIHRRADANNKNILFVSAIAEFVQYPT